MHTSDVVREKGIRLGRIVQPVDSDARRLCLFSIVDRLLECLMRYILTRPSQVKRIVVVQNVKDGMRYYG